MFFYLKKKVDTAVENYVNAIVGAKVKAIDPALIDSLTDKAVRYRVDAMLNETLGEMFGDKVFDRLLDIAREAIEGARTGNSFHDDSRGHMSWLRFQLERDLAESKDAELVRTIFEAVASSTIKDIKTLRSETYNQLIETFDNASTNKAVSLLNKRIADPEFIKSMIKFINEFQVNNTGKL